MDECKPLDDGCAPVVMGQGHGGVGMHGLYGVAAAALGAMQLRHSSAPAMGAWGVGAWGGGSGTFSGSHGGTPRVSGGSSSFSGSCGSAFAAIPPAPRPTRPVPHNATSVVRVKIEEAAGAGAGMPMIAHQQSTTSPPAVDPNVYAAAMAAFAGTMHQPRSAAAAHVHQPVAALLAHAQSTESTTAPQPQPAAPSVDMAQAAAGGLLQGMPLPPMPPGMPPMPAMGALGGMNHHMLFAWMAAMGAGAMGAGAALQAPAAAPTWDHAAGVLAPPPPPWNPTALQRGACGYGGGLS